ncbi:hypothetical protein F4Y59_00875 [Candidatus Poribacteria bacterium]|nr:hypothetical protein [Candidatus Poribacteria bacterium]MYK19598.1 hypothetical protein [Candidatus Poribacteria bacterium]
MLNKIVSLDKRIIFIFVALAVIIPTMLKPRLPVTVSTSTQNIYDYVEALPPGATILISFDYGPSSMPEPTAIAETVLRHCFTKGVKVIGITLVPDGVLLADSTLKKIAREKGAVEGKDYTYLGFRPGIVSVILAMGSEIAQVFDSDYAGNSINEIPLMQHVTNYDEIDLMFTLAAGNTVENWITYAHTKYDLKIAAGTTAVIATQMYPYLQTGQLVGLLSGYLGAAEYERLSGTLGDGTTGINTATWVHILIIGLVVIGNIVFFIQQRQQKNNSST